MPESIPDPGIASRGDQIIAEVVDTRDGRQCTIYPAETSDEELVTTWMTADEGSFVALDEMR